MKKLSVPPCALQAGRPCDWLPLEPRDHGENVPGIFLAGTAISGGKQTYKDFIDTRHGHAQKITKQITGVEYVPVGTVQSRRYPFSRTEIETTALKND